MTETDIAVVGMGCRLPGAQSPDAFWSLLQEGRDGRKVYSDRQLRQAGESEKLLTEPNYVRANMPIDGMKNFDAQFFGLSPKEAEIMDPQHRHFLEVAWEGLECAGYAPGTFDGSIGVYAGCGMNTYWTHNIMTNPDLMETTGWFLLRHTGNDKDFLATRVSYEFDLQGPSVNIQTACSTSLVAIHHASQALLANECDMALAGGVTIDVHQDRGYPFREGEILSPDGHCRAFDVESNGTVFGSGVGVVVLRRFEDAVNDGDTVHAVVKGSAINNDGSRKVGYLAPSVEGHAEAVAEALGVSEINARDVSYVEAHGTGTRVGDPIEIEALTQAFRAYTEDKSFCTVGSVKTNIGHLDTAAGVASFLKVVLALKNRKLPPMVNFTAPNELIDFPSTPFLLNDRLLDWNPEGKRVAGVSSLGVGGTNAHVILEEAPAAPLRMPAKGRQVLQVSAKNEAALSDAVRRLGEFLHQHPETDLRDASFTLDRGRARFPHRTVVVASDASDASEKLLSNKKGSVHGVAHDGEVSVVFMFPGGGAQYPNMGRGLYETEAVYREVVDSCLKILQENHGIELGEMMFPAKREEDAATERLKDPCASVLSIFITEYALTKLLESWGIVPTAMTGHSLGEYAAACVAGVMSVEDALALVTMRGSIFERLPDGEMLAVPLPEAELVPLLEDGLSLAAVNAPELCVVSGEKIAIAGMEATLENKGVESSRLHISVAAHSEMLEPFLDEFARRFESIELKEPQIPFMSNLTGTWIEPGQATDPTYWVRHIRRTVRFADGLERLLRGGDRVMLEVGPGTTLGSLVRAQTDAPPAQSVLATLRHPQENLVDEEFLLNAIGRLWTQGFEADWDRILDRTGARRIPLPTYAFQHKEHWIPAGKILHGATEEAAEISRLEGVGAWLTRPVWRETGPLQGSVVRGEAGSWMVFCDEHGCGDAVVAQLRDQGLDVIEVRRPGASGTNASILDPNSETAYQELFQQLSSENRLPTNVIHLWSIVDPDDDRALAEDRVRDHLQVGFLSLLQIVQQYSNLGKAEDLRVCAVTDAAQDLLDKAPTSPEGATVSALCRVIPREYPGALCTSVDILSDEIRGAEAAKRMSSCLINELSGLEQSETVAFRGSKRFVQSHEPTTLDGDDQEGQLREQGVYLITGGLGGIGLAIAEYLAREHQARLILVGRRALPPRDEWAAHLNSSDSAGDLGQQVRRLNDIQELGGEILYQSADVSDTESMVAVVAAAKERFGQIHGVFHTAGVIDDQLLALKSVEDSMAVLRPKVLGTLALDAATESEPLDFMVLFSSTSAYLGLAGQSDYAAANAFLDAFAAYRSKSSGRRTIAINWGAWAQVGMAATAAHDQGLVEIVDRQGRLVQHPLLDREVPCGPGGRTYESVIGVESHWVLSEHRTKARGPLLPGTGYVELVRTALGGDDVHGAVAIDNLVFVAPLEVAVGEHKKIRVQLEPCEEGFEVTVSSDSVGQPGSPAQVHAQGFVRHQERNGAETRDIEQISARCQARKQVFVEDQPQTRQEDHLLFGGRWRNLREVRYGDGEALASLELPQRFQSDLDEYALHPALLDIATGFALPLIQAYEECEDLYVPLMYQSIRIKGRLPARILSHARVVGDNDATSQSATFDIDIMDQTGRVLVEVRGFVLKRIVEQSRFGADSVQSAQASVLSENEREAETPLAEQSLLELSVRMGIRPYEGVDVLLRLLASGDTTEVTVSPISVHALFERVDDEMEAAVAEREARHQKARESTAIPTLDDPVEAAVAEIWSELLGVDDIARDDEFLDLGGHSLLGLRCIAMINSRFGTDIQPTTLFDHPTVEGLASVIKTKRPELVEELGTPAKKTVSGPEKSGQESATRKQDQNLPSDNQKTGPQTERGRNHGVEVDSQADMTAIASVVPEMDRAGSSWNRHARKKAKYRMRESLIAKYLLTPIYRIPRVRLRRLLQWLILKLEGGEWFTVTLRKLYAKYHDMQIGDYSASCFNPGYLKPGTKIGRYCSIFTTARIETANHPTTTVSSSGLFYRSRAGFADGFDIPRHQVEIGHDVHLGHNATIVFPAKKIGTGAVIGSGALVSFDVPPYAIVSGYPATIIRYRFSKEKIEELLASRWWEASLEDLEPVKDEFVKPVEGRRVR